MAGHETAQEGDQFRRGSQPNRTLKQLSFDLCGSREESALLPTREAAQDVRSHLPGAGRWPRIHV